MNRFSYAQPRDFEQASTLATGKRFSLPILKAGGMDVLDHLKEGLIEPDVLIDIRRLRVAGMQEPVSLAGAPGSARFRIEATATLTDLATSAAIIRNAPVVAQAVDRAATPQVRNVATAAGNLLQRPRCWYYRHQQFDCLKKGGSMCYAVAGENRYHAVFGPGPCHIVHPSNLAPALWVCDATVHLMGSKRQSLPISELYHMPDKGMLSEHNLDPGEIVTHISFRAAPRSGFYAIKEKQTFDWPLVMAAVALELDGTRIKSARVCVGAVAPVPWPLPGVERALTTVDASDAQAVRNAVGACTVGAAPMSDNAYKLRLLPVAVERAVLKAAGQRVEDLA